MGGALAQRDCSPEGLHAQPKDNDCSHGSLPSNAMPQHTYSKLRQSRSAIQSPREEQELAEHSYSRLPLSISPLQSPRQAKDEDQMAEVVSNSSNVFSVVQFGSRTFYCEEGEPTVEVDVVRFGDASRPTTFDFKTVDSTGKAGMRFEQTSGSLTFQPGETMKTIEIPIIENDSFDSILEFKLVITRVQGASVGHHLHTCIVIVIDDDSFPTNKYRELLFSGREHAIPGCGLLFEYFRQNLSDPLIKAKTIKVILCDQIKGLYFFLTLYLTVYLVDVVLVPIDELEHAEENEADRRLLLRGVLDAGRRLRDAYGGGNHAMIMNSLMVPHHRRLTAVVIAFLYVVPFALQHFIDYQKQFVNLSGTARRRLQANLLRRYLYYKPDVRTTFRAGQLTLAMLRDVREIVDAGYMKAIELFRIIGKLFLAMAFIVNENKLALVPLVVYPFILVPFLWYRERVTVETAEKEAAAQDAVLQMVDDTVQNYDLISDFKVRPLIIDGFEQIYDNYYALECTSKAVITNSLYMVPWLTTFTIGACIIVGAGQVETVGGSISLGAFMATLSVFKDLGSEIQEIYREVQEMQKSIGPLRKVARFINLETDLIDRMHMARGIKNKNSRSWQAARRSSNSDLKRVSLGSVKPGDFTFPIDKVEISVHNLYFGYPARDMNIRGMSYKFEQGTLNAILGPPGECKSTFLRLLGQVVLPTNQTGGPLVGESPIFVPTHLRILHVGANGTLLRAPLLNNILLSNSLEQVGGIGRVRSICRKLGFSQDLMALIDASELSQDLVGARSQLVGERRAKDSWWLTLTHTDFDRIRLARVLILNPELLIIHKPLENFAFGERKEVMTQLREHVDNKGLDVDRGTVLFSRPRTVFFSSSSLKDIHVCDEIFKVSTRFGIERLAKANLEEDEVFLWENDSAEVTVMI
eukprot:TRINITY_DN27666_c0_g1_i1.p1 TRINITY_DN27666_c0_g1~~TRINITY_DN27666_c0_g1_i1.p1  ORF type:complete len:922 (-),score=139.42 TRINITY_DN27666_c0_g1_i1:292-3057(-)